jgi:hypothetical protein
MERPHTQISEKPKKFCTICKREVFKTVHTTNSYWADWFGTPARVICVDCYKDKL